MPPITPTQRVAITQFVGFTQAKETVAAKTLKQHGWNVELAIDAFFQSKHGTTVFAGPNLSLNKLFDRYRGHSCLIKLQEEIWLMIEVLENPVHEPDTIGVEGSMRYLTDLGVGLDEAAVLVVLTELSAPTMGEITREGFVRGWKGVHADTLPKQQALIESFRGALTQSPEVFKRVYKTTFLLARTGGQKSLSLDTAIEYWRLMLQAPSVHWGTPSTPWLEWWIAYLEERWRKSVSKDMWDQTGVFVQKSLEDESMGWWSEDGAWPGVLDDFVGYVRERRKANNNGMDVEGE